MKKILLPILLCAFIFNCKNDKKVNSEIDSMKQDSIALIEKAKAIHKNVITLDTHNDININNFTDSINYTQKLDTQVNLPKMKEGGLDVAWFVVYTGQDTLTADGYAKAYENAISKFNAIHKLVEEIAPDQIALATTSQEVRDIVASGKLVAMIGVENAYPIGTDLKNIEKFYNLGARYMSLAHNGHSQLSDSNTGEENNDWLHNGLSELGKEAIKEMNRLGMMIDISHPSKEAIKQMIEISEAPVIASHSSARALGNHSRNLDDEQLEWIKKNGGVVQTVAFKSYVDPEKNTSRSDFERDVRKQVMEANNMAYLERADIRKLDPEARRAYYDAYNSIKPEVDKRLAEMTDVPEGVNVSDFVDHIDYLISKLDIDHVGISSDFDGGGGIEGWNDASETFNVTLELVKRGYTEEEIGKLWSGNLLRALDEVEAKAKEIQSALNPQ
ncbi:dipeptidase [Aegicerativicinus sediminis]|uniref:dipeptidase n=1 Tax=Aegicerativicinus sediminis TaxID=2893202 RepID=UPI0037438A0B